MPRVLQREVSHASGPVPRHSTTSGSVRYVLGVLLTGVGEEGTNVGRSVRGPDGDAVAADPAPILRVGRVDDQLGGDAPSVEEHHVVLWMLSELKDLDPADERFDAKMTVLIENVRHHVEEEEKEWFPEVRKAMGRNRLTELGEQMEKAKKKAPRDPLAVPSADR